MSTLILICLFMCGDSTTLNESQLAVEAALKKEYNAVVFRLAREGDESDTESLQIEIEYRVPTFSGDIVYNIDDEIDLALDYQNITKPSLF